MNPATIKMLLDAFSTARGRVKEYNEKKSREAYELLSDAAGRVDVDGLRARGEELLDEGRREAGNVTQAAHDRLDAARKRLSKAADNAPSRKQARKARRRRTWTMTGLATLLIAAVGGAVYWFTRRQQEPGDTPPRVEDFSGEDAGPTTESELVYSTATPGSPEEGVTDRDEQLLNSLDEQLETHRQAAEETDSDDPVNEDTVDDVTDPDAESGEQK